MIDIEGVDGPVGVGEGAGVVLDEGGAGGGAGGAGAGGPGVAGPVAAEGGVDDLSEMSVSGYLDGPIRVWD